MSSLLRPLLLLALLASVLAVSAGLALPGGCSIDIATACIDHAGDKVVNECKRGIGTLKRNPGRRKSARYGGKGGKKNEILSNPSLV